MLLESSLCNADLHPICTHLFSKPLKYCIILITRNAQVGGSSPPASTTSGGGVNYIALLLDYSFQSVLKNWKAVLVYGLVFVVLTLLSLIPVLSLVTNPLVQLLTIQIAVYYGTPLLKEVSKDGLYSFIENSTVGKVFTERFEVSAGIFLSSFVITLLISLTIVAVVLLSGIPFTYHSIESLEGAELTSFLLRFFALFLLIFLVISWYLYVYPIAMGYAMSKEGFGEAFLALFKIFSPSLWKKALSFKYFVFITVAGLLEAVFLFIGVLLSFTVIFIPVGIPFLYFSNVFFGGVAARSYAMTFKDELQSRS